MKLAALVLLVGCGNVVARPHPGDDGDDGGGDDAPITPDGEPAARCDPGKPFGTPTLLANVNTADDEISFALTGDERTAFVDHAVESPSYGASMLVAARASTDDPFDVPRENMTEQLNLNAGSEYLPFPSSDGLAVYFGRQSDDTSPLRLVVAWRDTIDTPFSDFEVVVAVDDATPINAVAITSANDERLYWSDPQLRHLHRATRNGFADQFAGDTEVSSVPMQNPVLSTDELTVYYSDGVETDILAATRADLDAKWGVGVPVANVNSADNDAPAFLTRDGCVLYLKSNRTGGIGGFDIWEARRPR